MVPVFGQFFGRFLDNFLDNFWTIFWTRVNEIIQSQLIQVSIMIIGVAYLIISLIILFCLIFLAIKFNPIWNKIEIVEKNPWHNGTVYQINLPCKNNKNEICKQKFETQPFFYEVLTNFSKVRMEKHIVRL